MAKSKPVELCNHVMQSGKPCRGVALRNERYCRSHHRTYRLLERERALQDSMSRLSEKLEALDLVGVLLALQHKLEGLQSVFGPYPDVSFTLSFAISRLDEVLQFSRQRALASPQNPLAFPRNPPAPTENPAPSPLESITHLQPVPNQSPTQFHRSQPAPPQSHDHNPPQITHLAQRPKSETPLESIICIKA